MAPLDPPKHALSAVMGEGARYEGDLTFEGRVRIDGTFVGRLYSDDVLEIGPKGRVEGAADVAHAVVAGAVDGSLRVRQRLLLQPTAWIKGRLDAGRVEIKPGARIHGEVFITGVEDEG